MERPARASACPGHFGAFSVRVAVFSATVEAVDREVERGGLKSKGRRGNRKTRRASELAGSSRGGCVLSRTNHAHPAARRQHEPTRERGHVPKQRRRADERRVEDVDHAEPNRDGLLAEAVLCGVGGGERAWVGPWDW